MHIDSTLTESILPLLLLVCVCTGFSILTLSSCRTCHTSSPAVAAYVVNERRKTHARNFILILLPANHTLMTTALRPLRHSHDPLPITTTVLLAWQAVSSTSACLCAPQGPPPSSLLKPSNSTPTSKTTEDKDMPQKKLRVEDSKGTANLVDSFARHRVQGAAAQQAAAPGEDGGGKMSATSWRRGMLASRKSAPRPRPRGVHGGPRR